MTLLGCSTLLSQGSERGDRSQPRRAAETVEHVILVTLDGVRPYEIFSGSERARARAAGIAVDAGAADLMPRLWSIVSRGIALGAPGGATFSVSGPNFVSLPGYTELLSGMPATCQENDCEGPPRGPTLVDAVCDTARAGERCDAALFSSWREIERVSALRRGRALVSAGRAGGEGHEVLRRDPKLDALYQRGLDADPAPGHGTYRPDRETAALALAYLATQRPRFTFIGLGDTDELAHAGDYAGYLRALRDADRLIGAIDDISAQWAALGESTIVVVTTDHGRSESFRDHGRDHPESQRAWLVAAGPGILPLGAVALTKPRFVRDLAPTLALALGVSLTPARTDLTILTEVLAAR